MPEAKSVIAMAFRVMRGSLRGIEEGTFFSNYSSMGYGGLTYLYIPLVVINLCKFIEDAGYEAVPIGHQSDWRGIDENGKVYNRYSRPVAPGRASPDVQIHLRIAAYLAGLGEIGYSKVFLTPRLGPRQRLGVVVTEAVLEGDEIYAGPKLCDRCMACVKQCPGNAISATGTVKLELCGRTLEWGKLDTKACTVAFRGGRIDDDVDDEDQYDEPTFGRKIARSEFTPFYHKPRRLYNTGEAICGGRGCMRACMIQLEKRGVLENRFESPFRRREPWSVDWSQPQGEGGLE
jgi:epoxyqueuosine reductase